jgi:hypothetical protein
MSKQYSEMKQVFMSGRCHPICRFAHSDGGFKIEKSDKRLRNTSDIISNVAPKHTVYQALLPNKRLRSGRNFETHLDPEVV